MSARTGWFTLVVASSVLAVISAATASGNGWSMVPLLWFLAVIPGLPYVRLLLSTREPIAFGVAAVGLSLAVDALVAEALLYADGYTAFRTVFVLAAIACLGAVIGRLRHAWDAPEPAESSDATERV